MQFWVRVADTVDEREVGLGREVAQSNGTTHERRGSALFHSLEITKSRLENFCS